MCRFLRACVFASAPLFLSLPAVADNWRLTETRPVVHPDTSFTPAKWVPGEDSVAGLKSWISGDNKTLSIKSTCSWAGVPGGFSSGSTIPVSVKLEQLNNNETGYDSWVKLYFGEEGSQEGDGPDVLIGWREGRATRSANGSFTMPAHATGRLYFRTLCKIAGDTYQVFYYYTADKSDAHADDNHTASSGAGGWDGAWSTGWGAMQLRQMGAQVSGNYQFKGGRIEGRMKGDTLVGRWKQQNGQGRFIFRLSADGRSFSGTYGYGESDNDGGGWSGSR